MVITLGCVGKWLKARQAPDRRGNSALQAASRYRADSVNGVEQSVAIAVVKAGDEVVIRPGERIPMDVQVLEKASRADESMLRGAAAHRRTGREDRPQAGLAPHA